MLRRHRATWRLAVGSAAVGLVVAAGAVALSGPWDAGQRTAERDHAATEALRDGADTEGIASTVAAAAPVLAPLDGRAPEATPAAVERAIGRLLDNAALGDGAAGAVVDISTGDTLYRENARSPRTPASTIKVLTSVAALNALGADHRLATSAVWDPEERRVHLVGGGDTTLTDDDLARLARRTADALAERDVDRVRIAYDISLYPREQHHPIGSGNTNIATITPLQLNAGRLDDSSSGPAPRSDEPAADAARTFAGHLRAAGVEVTGATDTGRAAPEGADELAVHRSAPLSSLVERMLTHSDNDLAEALARATAVAAGHPADFRGVDRALTGELEKLDLPLSNVRIADASGLDRDDRVTAAVLTQALAAAADPERPELRAALTGLPVAGFTGTLQTRYDAAGGGAGLVRAKTGTLTGVNTLAGTAVTGDGRVLAFAFLASDTDNGEEAEAALDAAASALATCGCH
ncbi:D-alanyl-D-alanine carboxypeptidase/D-alanyl-D-alanine-endopeptidase [Streptomyces radicis]|uniref:D-alanyl-D-alanine carboxypeptidase/D-alanyl-D-alanine-endopeptidase n=1 Tax=Streptomyces radicis TaxID=1750517 RepID=A0A3A9WKU0_9ACTN|nr:D-alanyl-D-alanine carboxypeptidase/D-alanyl-D-alanine-endopeptidase [Streptomyces radicis]RKN10074.1 D-alanyl-D-alanine carboxypeptidase/D-alanyl-D-alanine-endopeptidase [Streptomyces radicis]RKN24416.1 D-alanyl-D-alanine carboxypeptidase/D-alanyl-D-alanine-endopeptidase [Streptomyces radicis]